MSSVQIKLEGFAEVQRKLRELGPKIAANGLRSSTFAGARVFRDAVKQSAPVRTGFLQSEIVAVKRRGPAVEARYSITARNKPKVVAIAKRRAGRKRGKYRARPGPRTYGRFVEFGTSQRAAHPFMRPVFESRWEDALDAVRARMAAVVERAARE